MSSMAKADIIPEVVCPHCGKLYTDEIIKKNKPYYLTKRYKGQRNNISLLPFDIRLKIAKLLIDGRFQDEIRDDKEIKKACIERGLTIHNTTFLAYKKSKEFKEYHDNILNSILNNEDS